VDAGPYRAGGRPASPLTRLIPMPVEPEYVEFTERDLNALLNRMAALARDYGGWINLQPAVDVDDLPPPRTGLGALLSGRGPDVPLVTWTPGAAGRGRARPEPPTVGIQHGAGPRAVATLAQRGHAVPHGWVVLDDHAKRGLVAAVPPATPHDEVVGWLLGAATALCAVPLAGRWRAEIYSR
jgi:hypothetical protein